MAPTYLRDELSELQPTAVKEKDLLSLGRLSLLVGGWNRCDGGRRLALST
jgi:hypothetical protein